MLTVDNARNQQIFVQNMKTNKKKFLDTTKSILSVELITLRLVVTFPSFS